MIKSIEELIMYNILKIISINTNKKLESINVIKLYEKININKKILKLYNKKPNIIIIL